MGPDTDHGTGWRVAVTTILVVLLMAALAWYSTPAADAASRTATVRAACHAPRGVIPPPVWIKGRAAQPGQRRNVTAALNVARRMRAPLRHRVALVAAIIAEHSGWNKPWGHGTSVGILQLIDIHGSVQWRMQIRNSVGWFLRGARQVDPRGRWAPHVLAGAVQRPAGGSAVYRPHVGEAWRIVARYEQPCSRAHRQ